jgi:hypothetical protein
MIIIEEDYSFIYPAHTCQVPEWAVGSETKFLLVFQRKPQRVALCCPEEQKAMAKHIIHCSANIISELEDQLASTTSSYEEGGS